MHKEFEQVIRHAGAMMLTYRDAAIHQKDGHANFVTDADIAIEDYLQTELIRLVPGASFFAEEQENQPLSDALTFVVDPIDGTTNFMHHRQQSAISIGLLEHQRPIEAITFQPYSNELFEAELGHGAYLNGEKIHVSDTPFENAIITFGTAPYDVELAERTMQIAREFLLHAGDLRRTGSAVVDLTDLACGRSDVFFELRLRPWDVAAGSLIITEAGGEYLSLDFPAPTFHAPSGVLAASPVCMESALQIIKKFDRI